MAKKRWYAMELNGERFLLDTSRKICFPNVSQKSIEDVYNRPSLTKLHIFNSWSNWFVNNDGHCGVSSYNCNFFSIEGIVKDKATNKCYYCWITRTYNRCIEIA